MRSRIALVAVAITLIVLLSGCERKRPIGYMRLGKVRNLLAAETYFPEKWLILRRDNEGFYVMSTLCTKDLTPLRREVRGGKKIWVSDYTDSTYNDDGTVLSGPATRPLPRYHLEYGPEKRGGPVNMIYAEVGIRKKPNWRLPLPRAPKETLQRPSASAATSAGTEDSSAAPSN